MASKTLREELQELRHKIALVEQALETTMAWQYGLRNQADVLLDVLRADAMDDTVARVDALETELGGLRRLVQDLSQLITGQFRQELAGLAPPEPDRKARRRSRPEASISGGDSELRALTLARFASPIRPGGEVVLEAVADGFDDGARVQFRVGVRGDEPDTLVGSVLDGRVVTTWAVPNLLRPGTAVELVVDSPPFRSRCDGIVESADTATGENPDEVS